MVSVYELVDVGVDEQRLRVGLTFEGYLVVEGTIGLFEELDHFGF